MYMMLSFEISDSGSSLHTQLWIDPVEEFLQYAHTGNPVDVTFGVKELKVHQFPIHDRNQSSIIQPYALSDFWLLRTYE